MSACAVFLDRDGVLNEIVVRAGLPASPRTVEEFRLRAGAAEAVAALRGAGLRVFVVTNQPDAARGLLPAEVRAAHEQAVRALGVDDVRVCPHDDADGCTCRKPGAGMLLELAREWRLELPRCYMIGDSWRDVAAGRAAGCATVLIENEWNDGVEADVRVRTVGEAAAAVLASEGTRLTRVENVDAR